MNSFRSSLYQQQDEFGLTERVEEKDWLLVSALLQFLGGVGHQEGVAIVDWVTELEDEDGISAHLFEFGSELEWGLAVVVKTVVPSHALKGLDVTAGEPVSLLVDHLDVWVVLGVDTPGAGTSLFLAVSVELWVAEDGHVLALVCESDGGRAVQALLVLGGEWENNWDGLVVGAVVENAVEVKGLEHFVLTHETLEWGGPTLGKDLVPLGIQFGHLEFWKTSSLLLLSVELIGGDEKFLEIDIDKRLQML